MINNKKQPKLLALIIQEQEKSGLNDTDWAIWLGVKRQTWNNTKLGFLGLGYTVLVAVRRRLPALKDEIDKFIEREA